MVPAIALNDGHDFPMVGLGVMGIPEAALPTAMQQAVQLGYRSFDTAPVYGNERGVGRGLNDCRLARTDVKVTTKLWNDRQGYDEALRAFDESAAQLALDYVDVYLIHWPVPARGRYLDSWRALVRLREEGRVRTIGVSNFLPEHLERIIGETGVAPALNQVELHPAWQQQPLRAVHASYGIVAEAWSPLGRGQAIGNPQIATQARRLGCTEAQLILAYLIKQHIVVIPKASSVGHMRENIESARVELDDEAIGVMQALDRPDGRFGPDPMTFDRIPPRA